MIIRLFVYYVSSFNLNLLAIKQHTDIRSSFYFWTFFFKHYDSDQIKNNLDEMKWRICIIEKIIRFKNKDNFLTGKISFLIFCVTITRKFQNTL